MFSPLRLLCTVSVIGPLAAGLTSTAASARSASPAITITGTLPQLPTRSATVVVEVERQADRNAHGVAQRLIDTPVAEQTVTAPEFSVAVPASSTLTRAEINGEATFVVLAYSGSYSTVQEKSAPMTRQAAQGNVATLPAAAGHTLALSRFNPWQSMPASQREALAQAQGPIPSKQITCLWNRYGNEREGLARISQLHLANVSGLQAHWRYSTTADTTMSVGFSNSPASGYTASGTFTATNSIGTDSGFTRTTGTRRYVVGQAYWQRYRANFKALCGHWYKNTLDHMVGSSGLGTRRPAANPYGGCLNDPFGQATVHPGEFFGADRAKAVTLGGAATVWGFTFSESTGFTSGIHHNYTNNSNKDVYLCGRNYMPNVPMIYNNRT
jgi:hypothetical protein